MAAFRLQTCALGETEMAEADILIRPEFEPDSYGNFSTRDVAIQAGYDAARLRMDDVLAALAQQ